MKWPILKPLSTNFVIQRCRFKMITNDQLSYLAKLSNYLCYQGTILQVLQCWPNHFYLTILDLTTHYQIVFFLCCMSFVIDIIYFTCCLLNHSLTTQKYFGSNVKFDKTMSSFKMISHLFYYFFFFFSFFGCYKPRVCFKFLRYVHVYNYLSFTFSDLL